MHQGSSNPDPDARPTLETGISPKPPSYLESLIAQIPDAKPAEPIDWDAFHERMSIALEARQHERRMMRIPRGERKVLDLTHRVAQLEKQVEELTEKLERLYGDHR